jgi:hypothetical protein
MKIYLNKIITSTFALLGFVLWLSQCRLTAQQNIVQNGSFENGYQNGPVDWGWTYIPGLALGFPDAADGSNWADVYGTLFQTLQTTPGQEYQLQFALSGNFNISAPSFADVLWDGVNIGNASWSPAGHNINNMGWVWVDFDVTAPTSSSLLTFENPFVGDGSGRIPRIDAVSVEAVPEPAGIWLLCFGLLAFCGLTNRCRQRGMAVPVPLRGSRHLAPRA